MALKALLLRKRIDAKKKELDQLRARDAEYATRAAELEQAIEETETDEQRTAVEEEITAFETDRQNYSNSVAELENEINELEGELAEEEAAQNTDPAPAESSERARNRNERIGESDMPRERDHTMTRARVFGSMTAAEQSALIERNDVREFLETVRYHMRSAGRGAQTRAINNIGLTIPSVLLGLLRENVLLYSKLYKHVTVSNIRGEGRILISGGIPEAVWTECCANLNELSMTFYQDAFGCWKLGGFFVVCNANLEDSDINLAAEILSTLGQSIGYTDDKTILYGNGTSMPMGIVTRLAQTSQPAGYPATARPWVDLHSSNVKVISDSYTGIALFQQIAIAAGAAKNNYSRGEKVWVMNEATHTALMAEAMNINAVGAITSGVNGTMPVLGGVIEILPDSIIPNNNILMGYMDLYRMVERAGEQFASSDQYLFLSDQTVFKGTVRWDGKPVIAEAFVLIGIKSTSPTTSATFAGDGANEPESVWLPATATVAVSSKITLAPVLSPYGVHTTYTWASGTEAKATVNSSGEVTGVAAGSSVITVTTANGLTAQCTVTVTSS